jgi:hypothetical protein
LVVREISCSSGWNAISVSCEPGSEASDLIKCRGYLDKRSDYQPLRKTLLHEVRFYPTDAKKFTGCGFVVISDDDPVRVHANGSAAAVQLAVSIFQQPYTLMSSVSHSARLLQRQPAESGHPRAGSQLPGRYDFVAYFTTLK